MEVVLTRGLPASGKSTWAREFCASSDYYRWNNDEFSYMVTGIVGPGSFGKMDGKFLRDCRKRFLNDCILQDRNVVLDNTNLSPYAVDEFLHILKPSDTVRYVDFKVSVDECIERDALRTPSVGKSVILKMADKWGHLYDWI